MVPVRLYHCVEPELKLQLNQEQISSLRKRFEEAVQS